MTHLWRALWDFLEHHLPDLTGTCDNDPQEDA